VPSPSQVPAGRAKQRVVVDDPYDAAVPPPPATAATVAPSVKVNAPPVPVAPKPQPAASATESSPFMDRKPE
jgi:hypothetical protein